MSSKNSYKEIYQCCGEDLEHIQDCYNGMQDCVGFIGRCRTTGCKKCIKDCGKYYMVSHSGCRHEVEPIYDEYEKLTGFKQKE